ncbi:MAG: hypothetical protein AMXMBFR84_13570 [Candidatus Hydrogenedentota bacterium]
MVRLSMLSLICMAGLAAVADVSMVPAEHGTVFRETGRFGGWPANNGIWIWDNEIVVGFTLGYLKIEGATGHPIDRDRPSESMLARSLDGGVTWSIEKPSFALEKTDGSDATECPGGLDFTNPNSALRFKMNVFYYSPDRCKTWQGPFKIPSFDRPGMLARTDYMVQGKHELVAFMAAEKDDGKEGWPCAIKTTDGGKTWELLGYIGTMPESGGYSIMPSTLEMKNGSWLSIIRRRTRIEGGSIWWIEGYLSPDKGKSWYLLKEPYVDNRGNPASMIRLQDGRIAMTYGFRGEPYGIRVRFSKDEGQTWGPEHIIQDKGGDWDIGYPRTVQRPDGKCFTAYYFNDEPEGERYIAYSIWDPSAVKE